MGLSISITLSSLSLGALVGTIGIELEATMISQSQEALLNG